MATETVAAVPRVKVRRWGARPFPWMVLCKQCPPAHRPSTIEQEALAAWGINTPLGWRSQRGALDAALNHLRRVHLPAEPPC